MAVRQYVGARYVPKFYENSLGTAEWQSGIAYEPLTIVTYNGNSFTSKKEVPASIGAPNENPTYWASTGIYNAQIDEYREETAAAAAAAQAAQNLANELQKTKNNKKLNDSRFIFVGDSYLLGGRGGVLTPNNGWGAKIKSMLNLADNACYIVGQDGGGFASNRPGGGYANQLENAVADITDRESIDYVIACGGQNDIAATEAAFNTGVQALADTVAQYFPNAKCYIGMIAWDQVPSKQIQLNEVMEKYIAGIDAVSGVEKPIYLSGVENSLYNMAWFGSDNSHPTVNGYESIANHVIQAINGHASTFDSMTASAEGINGFSGSVSNIGCTISNNIIRVEIPSITLTSTTGVSFVSNGGNLDVARFTGLPKGSTRYYRGLIGVMIARIRDNNGTYEALPMSYTIHDNKLSVIALNYVDGGAGRRYSLTELMTAPITIEIPMF